MEKSKIILSRDCLPYYLCQIEKNRYSRHRKKQKFLNVMMNTGKETCAFIFNKHFWIAKKMQSILVNSKFPLLSIKSINNNKTKHNLRSNLKKTRAAANKNTKVQGTRNKLFLAKMNSTHMLEIYLRYQWKWLIWTTHNKLSPWQLWCPSTTFWKYWGKGVFAYVKVPRHVSDELLKLHGIGFKGKMLVIEKVKTPPKAKNINGMNQNTCPQMQPSQLDSDPENYVASRPFQRIKNLSKCCHP